ncbi:hypothetical protein GGR57DRAFT_510559 [Xylariaceae sp. FL1272]|nr:hypothetical protein GGR57DRAFT_510559 [Xylariaceae sp. FL1272]
MLPKPGNADAFKPKNNLIPNKPNAAPQPGQSQAPFSASQFALASSHPTQPSPKRQRIDKNATDTAHSQIIAIPPDSPTATVPQKRSRADSSIADSQLSQGTKSAKTESTPNGGVSEFRTVEQHTNPRRKRRRRQPSQGPGPDERKKLAMGNSDQSKPVEEISDDDMEMGPVTAKTQRLNNDVQQQTNEKGGLRQAPEIAKYWSSSAPKKFEELIDRVEKKGKKTTQLMNSDDSPDELAHNPEDLMAANRLKVQRKHAPSLSRNGDIKSTQFSKRASAANPKRMQHPERHLDVAKSIIRHPLRIVRGACGKCGYDKDNSMRKEIFLLPRSISHTLHAVDHNGDILAHYTYLTVNLSNVQKILYNTDRKSCIIVITQAQSLAISAGPRLIIELESRDAVDEFVAWTDCLKEDHHFTIQHCSTAQLEKLLAEMMDRPHSETVLLDEDVGAQPDDLRLMQKNQDNRISERNRNAAAASPGRPKLKDGMEADPNRDVTSNMPPSTQLGSKSSLGHRPTRQKQKTTQSYFAVEDSPEAREPEPQEPEPERWTWVNQGWENEWRNSLVFPEKGKNRATIDKGDIQRLDEGEFLNDNIIIFYLRYLQQKLEEEQPAWAKRIYFQNTFFYDKLKPTKASQGINYERVKGWTSKVDLFEKDFIIVPINEYSHWYVAIICHAPKLVPPSDNTGNTPDAAPNTITIPDEPEGIKGKSLPSTQESSKEDVVEHLKRMSIGSPNEPSNMTKKAVETSGDAEEQIAPIEQCQAARVVSDVTKPESDSKHAVHDISPRRKKTGKRQGTLRKLDPTQPRIITLDSLGGTHSPTCGNLRQYLVAELEDKKKVTMATPGPSGMTARSIPEQSNHCDCGLYLLGYIQQFLHAPDDFVRRLCQRDDPIPWNLNPSTLRNDIRNLIFGLQKEQRKNEDKTQEEKRKRKTPQKAQRSSPIRPSIENPDNLLEQETMGKFQTNGKNAHSNSPPSRPSALKASHHAPCGRASILDRQPESRHHKARMPHTDLLSSGTAIVGMDPNISHVENPRKRAAEPMARHQPETEVRMAPSPKRTALAMSSQSTMPGTFPTSPAQEGRARSLSRESEGTSLQKRLVNQLSSMPPSSISSRNGTPNDPLVVDDSEHAPQQRGQPSPRNQTSRIVIELPSLPLVPGAGDRTAEKVGTTLSPTKSPHFPDYAGGETVTAARLSQTKRHKKPPGVIDLSGE